jgi:ribosomal protein S18 acetylase RimI-like enzyme
MNSLHITNDNADVAAIEHHLRECDMRFEPPLSSRVSLPDYAQKLSLFADRFEAWESDRLIGLVAAYLRNSHALEGFISSVSICGDFEGKGIASRLMQDCFDAALAKGLTSLVLEVAQRDQNACGFYRKHGFQLISGGKSGLSKMSLQLKNT